MFEMDMSKDFDRDHLVCIMYDSVDWQYDLGPVFVVGSNKTLVRCYIGIPIGKDYKIDKEALSHNLVGIYIASSDYDKINHNLPYIFFNIFDCDNLPPSHIITWIDKVSSKFTEEDIPENPKIISRSHIHIERPVKTLASVN